MLTKEQLNIFRVFKLHLFAELTFKQIKAQSNQRSNNVVQLAIRAFKEEELLKTKITGDVTTYSLNLENNLALAYMNLINEEELKKRQFPKDLLKSIKERISKHTEFFILIVFGSHAKNSATKKSDLDIAIIVESENTKKEITPYIETIKRRELIKKVRL